MPIDAACAVLAAKKPVQKGKAFFCFQEAVHKNKIEKYAGALQYEIEIAFKEKVKGRCAFVQIRFQEK